MHSKVLDEAGDLECAVSLESRRSEEERLVVHERRPHLDQNAEGGRVDEVDLREVDDQPFGLFGRQLE